MENEAVWKKRMGLLQISGDAGNPIFVFQ